MMFAIAKNVILNLSIMTQEKPKAWGAGFKFACAVEG